MTTTTELTATTTTTTTKSTKLSKKTSSSKLKVAASDLRRSSLRISQSKLSKLKAKSGSRESVPSGKQRPKKSANTTELASSHSIKPVGDLDAQMRPIASSSIASYSVKCEPVVPPVAKTPSKAVHKNLLAIIEASAQKTGGGRVSEAVTASGKVKQMIEMVRGAFNVPKLELAFWRSSKFGEIFYKYDMPFEC